MGKRCSHRILQTTSTLNTPTFWLENPRNKAAQSIQDTVDFRSEHHFSPLNGVVAGLQHARSHFDSALFLPCDTPFLSSECLLKLLRDTPSVAVDPSGRSQPLLLHIPTAWIERANHYLSFEGSMKAFAEPAGLVELPHDSLRNLNNPSDLPTPIR